MTESDMKKVVRQVQAMYHKHRGTLAESALELPNLDPADENWREQLLSILQAMPPDAFERLAQRILLESGFVDVHVRGGDRRRRNRRPGRSTSQSPIVQSFLPMQ